MAVQTRYTRAFQDNVQGLVYAGFRLDANGAPLFEEDDDGLRHYQIEMWLVSTRADKIDRVTYTMLDPSFAHDPTAESADEDNDFLVDDIISFGDSEVEVTVYMSARAFRQTAWLSNLLEAGHQTNLTPTIAKAIHRIKEN